MSSHSINTDNHILCSETEESDYSEISANELLEMQMLMDPHFLKTTTMNELYDGIYLHKPPIIENLLHPGTYLFVGSPKIGKSFFMAQLAYHVSTGQPLWGYPVRQGTVLYMALEDNFQRLQNRFYRMFGNEGTDHLHLSITANQISQGLCKQLNSFVEEHPNTLLIIIDTLQKIRAASGEKYSYSADYATIGELKQFTDRTGICLLLVHHTRKQWSEDVYERTSGTNGLTGSADGSFFLDKEKRTDIRATLTVTGRDQPEQKFHLIKNMETLVWDLERAETEIWKSPPDPILEKLSLFITNENPTWCGSPTELVEALALDMKPNAFTRHLNVKASELKSEYGIHYDNRARNPGRRITLSKIT